MLTGAEEVGGGSCQSPLTPSILMASESSTGPGAALHAQLGWLRPRVPALALSLPTSSHPESLGPILPFSHQLVLPSHWCPWRGVPHPQPGSQDPPFASGNRRPAASEGQFKRETHVLIKTQPRRATETLPSPGDTQPYSPHTWGPVTWLSESSRGQGPWRWLTGSQALKPTLHLTGLKPCHSPQPVTSW